MDKKELYLKYPSLKQKEQEKLGWAVARSPVLEAPKAYPRISAPPQKPQAISRTVGTDQQMIILRTTAVAEMIKDKNLVDPKLTTEDVVSSIKLFVKAGVLPQVADIQRLVKVFREFGLDGRTFADGEYIYLNRKIGIQKLLAGTRFSQNDVKVVQLGLGKIGEKNQLIKTGVISLCFIAADNIDSLMEGEIKKFLVGAGYDTAASAITTAIASFVSRKLAATTATELASGLLASLVTLPAFANVAIGVSVGFGFAYLDHKFGIKQQIGKVLDEYHRAFIKSLEEMTRAYNAYQTPEGAMRLMQAFGGGGSLGLGGGSPGLP